MDRPMKRRAEGRGSVATGGDRRRWRWVPVMGVVPVVKPVAVGSGGFSFICRQGGRERIGRGKHLKDQA